MQGKFMSKTIEELMIEQTPTHNGWICPGCINYQDKLICDKRIMICFVGANMRDCAYFEGGNRCIHCGRIT
jgi:hypothetical protein